MASSIQHAPSKRSPNRLATVRVIHLLAAAVLFAPDICSALQPAANRIESPWALDQFVGQPWGEGLEPTGEFSPPDPTISEISQPCSANVSLDWEGKPIGDLETAVRRLVFAREGETIRVTKIKIPVANHPGIQGWAEVPLKIFRYYGENGKQSESYIECDTRELNFTWGAPFIPISQRHTIVFPKRFRHRLEDSRNNESYEYQVTGRDPQFYTPPNLTGSSSVPGFLGYREIEDSWHSGTARSSTSWRTSHSQYQLLLNDGLGANMGWYAAIVVTSAPGIPVRTDYFVSCVSPMNKDFEEICKVERNDS
jgi:hypothetical protein